MPRLCKYLVVVLISIIIIVLAGCSNNQEYPEQTDPQILVSDMLTNIFIIEPDTTTDIITEPIITEPITTEYITETEFITTDSETATILEEVAKEYNLDILDIVYIARAIAGEGGTGNMERAAVAWCILNRVDSSRFANTIQGVITSPNQFHLSYYIYDSDIKLAADVLERWYREKDGESNVGRVLPSGYYYFRGFKWKDKATELGMARPTKSHNWFFQLSEYHKDKFERNYWDWSLPNPYSN